AAQVRALARAPTLADDPVEHAHELRTDGPGKDGSEASSAMGSTIASLALEFNGREAAAFARAPRQDSRRPLRYPCAMSRLSTALRTAPALLLALQSGCIRDNNGRNAPDSRLQTRVGNNDVRSVDDQPDWNAQARELKQRVA